MKRVFISVALILASATVCLAENGERAPFEVSFPKLKTYLGLAPYQLDKVQKINDYFIDMQSESLNGNSKFKDKRMRAAVYGNLKLMKEALTPEQYRKYVTLINVTNNNNRVLSEAIVAK
ncbi:MAG: hypothetical protein LBR50_00075 [Tannerella sp.]|jgi:hypothetical protein|nr:hypothetical protein [Tannerella sp.]